MLEVYAYRVGYKSQIDSIFKHGYSRQFLGSNEGTMYGDGVYCNLDIYDSRQRLSYTPDGCIFKNKILNGIDRYLIFNEKYAQMAYGDNHSIKAQVYKLFPEKIANDVWSDFSDIMKLYPEARNHMNGRTAPLLQILLYRQKGKYRNKYENLFKQYDIKGVIYRGGRDGLCLVAYDFGGCIPVSYSLDGGKTFKEKEFKGMGVDVSKKYALNYKKIDEPIRLECDGDTFIFSRVLKKNNKWNYIDVNSGKEMSPIDFDSVTLINPEDGSFQIEYNGSFYDACPDGFFDDEDEGHTFDELPDFVNESLEKKFDIIFENAFNNAIKKILKEEKINENDIEELNYNGYNVEDENDFSDKSIKTLYHVAPSSVIDSIFKYKFDREFNNKNGNVYGAGVYTTSSPQESKNLLGYYGDTMIELKLIGGFDRFVVCNETYAKEIYGENYRVLEQLKTFLSEEDAKYLYERCGTDVRSYSKYASKFNIRGAIYKWNNSKTIIVFDFSSLLPYAISKDGGRTFNKKINDDTLNRLKTSIDVDYKYGNKYKRIDKAIAGYTIDGEKTGFSRVLKNNGKYNYIDVNSGEEISPIDFDSVTLINPENGEFDIEYQGNFFHACLDGFFDDEDEGHTFDELPDFVE